MPRRIRLHPYLTDHELYERYRHAHRPLERSRWQFLWLLARGLTAAAIARVTGYSAYWIGQIARRYNALGPDGVKDQRRLARPRHQLLTAAQHIELRAALRGPARRSAAPRHIHADPQAQADFKQRLRPLLREVATAFPQATVELWAVDEHRIGLKPILHPHFAVSRHQVFALLSGGHAQWR